MKTISCIGSGNMGTALMKGAAARVNPGNIGFSDLDTARAQAVAASLGAKFHETNAEAVLAGDVVFLAVKPQVMKTVLEEIAPSLKELAKIRDVPLLVSMAPGWSMGKITETLGIKIPLARIMPNTPALISQGLIAVACSPEVSLETAGALEQILGAAGRVDRVEESFFDAVTGLSGSGPAFAYLFIEALSDGGVRAGLPRDKALLYAAQTVLGSAAMVLETKKHPGELKDMVSSPGGTTIAGIAALEKAGFRGAVMAAVEAAWQRSVELGN